MASAIAGCGAQAPADDIVFVLVDTLRPDHLGTYGYERDTSPNLDDLAKRGIVFDQARSTAPWTNPAIASLFVGLSPQAVLPPGEHQDIIRLPLPIESETLAEHLQRAGYRTAALVDHPGISAHNHFGQGFETFASLFARVPDASWGDTPIEAVVEAIGEVFEKQDRRPLFLYLHVVYPHRPYRAPEPWRDLYGEPLGERRLIRANKEAMIDAYDAEIRYTDELIGRLGELLEQRGRRRTWTIVTSDHGEGFWEHGRAEHGNSLFDELLRIPMIVIPPAAVDLEPRRVTTPVSLVDLHPTVLEIAGVEPPPGLLGSSLLPLARGERPDRRALFSESPYDGGRYRVAVVSEPWKYILEGPRGERLHDIFEDPEERDPDRSRRDLRRSFRRIVDEHRARNETIREGLDSHESELDPETLERLRALGYVDD